MVTWSEGRPDSGDGLTTVYAQKFSLEAGSLVPITDKTALLENEPGVFGVSAASPILVDGEESGYVLSWTGTDESSQRSTFVGTLDPDLRLTSAEVVKATGPADTISSGRYPQVVAGSDGGSALAVIAGGDLYSTDLWVSRVTLDHSGINPRVAENLSTTEVIFDADATDVDGDVLSYSQWYGR